MVWLVGKCGCHDRSFSGILGPRLFLSPDNRLLPILRFLQEGWVDSSGGWNTSNLPYRGYPNSVGRKVGKGIHDIIPSYRYFYYTTAQPLPPSHPLLLGFRAHKPTPTLPHNTITHNDSTIFNSFVYFLPCLLN